MVASVVYSRSFCFKVQTSHAGFSESCHLYCLTHRSLKVYPRSNRTEREIDSERTTFRHDPYVNVFDECHLCHSKVNIVACLGGSVHTFFFPAAVTVTV